MILFSIKVQENHHNWIDKGKLTHRQMVVKNMTRSTYRNMFSVFFGLYFFTVTFTYSSCTTDGILNYVAQPLLRGFGILKHNSLAFEPLVVSPKKL